MCTEFAKGIAIGMVAGGTIGALVSMPKRRATTMGRILKTAGHIVDNISQVLGM